MRVILPVFPDFKPIELSDRAVIHPLVWASQPEISEICFTNFYIYQTQINAAWAELDDAIILLCNTKKYGYFYLPPIPKSQQCISPDTVQKMFEWLRSNREVRYPRIEKAGFKLATNHEILTRFDIEPLRDEFDYVYLSDDLIRLEGRKYHAKRNHLSRFLKSVPHEIEDLDSSNLNECITFLGKWCRFRDCQKNPEIMSECMACYQALNHFAELDLFGILIRVNGQVEAFSVGDRLNDRTILVHIEKGNAEVPGIYAAINHFFARRFAGEKLYINREQDMGDEGLRKAKLSYYPHHMVEKYRITDRS